MERVKRIRIIYKLEKILLTKIFNKNNDIKIYIFINRPIRLN